MADRYYAFYDGGTNVPVRAKSFKHAASIIARRERKLWPEGTITIKLEKDFTVKAVKHG